MHKQHKDILVFVPSGLGDAILLLPFLRQIKKQCRRLVGIFTSSFQCDELFQSDVLFDQKEVLHGSRTRWLRFAFKNIMAFDVAYLNHLPFSRRSFLLAKITARKVITSSFTLKRLPSVLQSGVRYIRPVQELHDALQNLRLVDENLEHTVLTEESIRLPISPRDTMTAESILKKLCRIAPSPYIVVQISAGNNINTYKNWPVEHWIQWLEWAVQKFPNYSFVLLGDYNEISLSDQIVRSEIPSVYSLVGKTSIQEVIEVIRKATVFVGLDGGLMHIAASLGKQTFTLWGPSDFNLYGYQKLNSRKHRIVFRDVNCRPCNSWIAPNTSRVSRPEDCPDRSCMRDLYPNIVSEEFERFMSELHL